MKNRTHGAVLRKPHGYGISEIKKVKNLKNGARYSSEKKQGIYIK